MANYRYRYLGRTTLPSRMTETEAVDHCTLSPEQLAAIPTPQVFDENGNRRRGRPPLDLRLGYAAQIAFLALTGRQAATTEPFPRAMLKVLCKQLGVNTAAIATLKSIYDAAYEGTEDDEARVEPKFERRLREHREAARSVLGFTLFDESVETALKEALAVRARDAATSAELVSFAEEHLFERHVVLPGPRRLEALAAQAFRVVEQLALDTIRAAIKPMRLRAILDSMFEEGPNASQTILEWLKQSAGKHGIKALNEVASRIDYLKSLGAAEWDLSDLSLNRIQAFAQAVIHRPPSETSRRVVDTQIVEIVCFLKYTLWELTDEAIFRSSRRTSDIYRQGTKQVQSKQAARTVEYRKAIETLVELATDKSKTSDDRIAEILKFAEEILQKPQISHAAVVRETMIQQGERVSGILDSIDCLDLDGDPSKKDIALVRALKDLRKAGTKELPVGFDLSAVDAVWRPYLEDPDRGKAYKALQACALSRIRKGLLGGRLWVSHSASFRSRSETLIPEEEWARDKEKLCKALGLETDPHAAIAKQIKLLEAGTQAVELGLDKGLLEIDEGGSVYVPKPRALEEEPELRQTAQVVQESIGQVQIPDLMIYIDVLSRFSSKLLGRDAKDAQELIALYAALLAHGTEIDAKAAAAMIPGVTVAQVTAAMRLLETPGRLREANEVVVGLQQKQSIVSLWSDGTRASSDMMALDTTRHLGTARTDPRRRTWATGIYTHVLGSYPIIYDQPIVLMTRQGGPAVEGIEQYNNTSEDRIKVQLLAVDTHGYTYAAMSLAKLLKFDLCPQLAGLPDCKLWLPKSMAVPDMLDQVAFANINDKHIVDGWDDMLRLVASIMTGRVTVSWALARNGSAAAGDRLYRALDLYGRLLRSVFLCDYFTNDDFRREIHTLLNRGESVHQLQRAIYYGRVTAERGRRRDELRTISGSHVLLTNLVICWNTIKMQEVLQRLKTNDARRDDDVVRRLGPVFFGNINFRGTLSFSIERYAEVLLKPANTSTTRRRA
jgi:TnpA family transposase